VVFLLLKFAIQDFKDDREYRNLSEKTIISYLQTLKEFQRFCGENEIVNVLDVKTHTIKSYILYCLKERKNNPTTRNSKLHILKIFFNYLESLELIDQKNNPSKALVYAREEIKIEAFSDYHIQQMLGYYRRIKQREKAFYAYRDYCIIVFLLGTGVRIGELINLKWSDVNLKNGVITVFGKKREQASIPITEKLVREMAEYKLFCQQHFSESSDYVFTSDRKNGKLAIDAIKSIFMRLKVVMNFKDVRLSGNTFRHTFAHRCLMAGMDVFSLQKMLRHSQITMTQRYLSIWGTALKDQNDKFNPLNNMDI
jgi:integrase/recombinase XerD